MTVMQTLKKPRIEAAVLVPVYRGEDGEIRLVLVKRTQGGIHGGQLAFPGGKRDPRDQSMLATALREAWEEIGLPPKRIQILASLRVVETRTTGFLVFPFLARVLMPIEWHRNTREIAEIIPIILSDLTRPEAQGQEMRHLAAWPEPRMSAFYRFGTYKIWGATYRILHPLIPRLLSGEWAI